MLIHEIIGLDLRKPSMISFVGGGGKSTTMAALGRELRFLGKKVLITTTTEIGKAEKMDNDEFVSGYLPEDYNPKEGTITLLGKMVQGEKLKGFDIEEIEEIFNENIFDVILIEADGARGKPIKAPADHEPVVTKSNTITIGIIGLDSLGTTLDQDNAHRPELLKKVLDVELPHVIESRDIVELVMNEEGLFKGTYGKKIAFLNKTSTKELISEGEEIQSSLREKGFENVYVTNMQTNKIY